MEAGLVGGAGANCGCGWAFVAGQVPGDTSATEPQVTKSHPHVCRHQIFFFSFLATQQHVNLLDQGIRSEPHLWQLGVLKPSVLAGDVPCSRDTADQNAWV